MRCCVIIGRELRNGKQILTIEYVPEVFTYDVRNPFTEAFIRAFVPRAVYFDKSDIARGRKFSETIWSYGDDSTDAIIAPSIIGDLYAINGPIWVAIGGFACGLLLGAIEGWKNMLRCPSSLLLLTYLSINFLMGPELDFARAIRSAAICFHQHFMEKTSCANSAVARSVLR